ncbi:MAG: hypothetical protein H0W40_18920 [Methylibium sp.]|uniref:hypothetical protein n=1 Tax=Methylibium sp. TaxID=2067992 RepID=UPI0017EFEE49|nr:hypothetical protein [Methylibium sp.]MBA3599421.1 hypothetical protein [Methylibium sp.]
MARSKSKAGKHKRDGSRFVALPMVVLDSPGYRQASHTARSLLLDIARQYSGNNNGKLTACAKYLVPLGWRSNDTIVRARRELLDCGLLVETRKGARPNKAAWFALSWLALDHGQGLDFDPKCYRTGDYMRPEKPANKNASLVPSDGAAAAVIAPPGGVSASNPAPSGGAVRETSTPSPAPSGGAYLETPSALPGRGVLSLTLLCGRRPELGAQTRTSG